ncbi:MAG: hypothetical protein SOR79_07695 [Blautia sp.]|uniref:hypothetical protein n=1 Tax=Blautia sp. TaxID=1955243 RepID=UPI002A753BEB|nr:hypothetical protein [Blautia sp.]MDY3017020.1 hypothetical protein [Blautia sp.]
MSDYFMLRDKCDYVDGKNGVMIFDFYNKKAFHLHEKESKVFRELMEGKDIQTLETDMVVFVKNMCDSNLGYVASHWKLHEPVHKGILLDVHSELRLLLQKIYIELPLTCASNCDDCNVIKLNGCYNCRLAANSQWNKGFYYQLINEVSSFKFPNIYFFGGNILSSYENVLNIFRYTRLMTNEETNIFLLCNVEMFDEKFCQVLIKLSELRVVPIVTMGQEDIGRFISKFVANESSTYKEIKWCINLLCDDKSIKNYISLRASLINFENVIDVTYSLTYTDKQILYPEVLPKIICDESNFNFIDEISTCLSGSLSVDSEGNVYPCPEISEKLGQIVYGKNQTLFNILDQREKILEIWGLGAKVISPCCECEYRKSCSDCRAIDYKKGNIHLKTVCNQFKE